MISSFNWNYFKYLSTLSLIWSTASTGNILNIFCQLCKCFVMFSSLISFRQKKNQFKDKIRKLCFLTLAKDNFLPWRNKFPLLLRNSFQWKRKKESPCTSHNQCPVIVIVIVYISQPVPCYCWLKHIYHYHHRWLVS